MFLRRFFFRLRRSQWLHPQSLLVIFVLLFMLGLILSSGGSPDVTGTAVQVETAMYTDKALLLNEPPTSPLKALAITATPVPELILSDEQHTDGVILAAALVVLVIVGGTMFSINRRK
ncbi:MAG TPA: hypothetical protein VFF78_08265 [Anaerolineaceae bacterium]|nr:hypothetical protein [Anaerolineaceae bacterium]